MATAPHKIVRRVTDANEQRQETYRYWRSRTCAERLAAVDEIIRDAYLAKGIDIDKLPSNRTIVRVERAMR